MSKNNGAPLPPSYYSGQPQGGPAQPYGAPVPPHAHPAPVQPPYGAPQQVPMPQSGVPQPAAPQPGAPQPGVAPQPMAPQPVVMPQAAVPQPVFSPQAMPAAQSVAPQPVAPQPVAPHSATAPQAPARAVDSEVFLGGKIVGVIAAILVLSGLVLLGGAFIPQLPDAVKAALIFLFSLVFTAGGAFLVKKSHNVFAYALFACGLAAFFVAIWVSWVHFSLFSHTVALVLSGIWMAISVGLLMYTRSWAVTIVITVIAGLFGPSFLEGRALYPVSASDFEPFCIAAFVLLVLYVIALCIAGIKLALDQGASRVNAAQSTRTKCLANVFVAEATLLVIGVDSTWNYSTDVMIVLIAGLLLALAFVSLPAPLSNNQVAWRINEIIVLFLVAFAIILERAGTSAAAPVQNVVSFGLFTLAAITLAGLRAFNRTKEGFIRPDSAVPVLFAIALTCVIVHYVCSVAFSQVSPYVWSATTIVCALATIAAGFWFAEKPLRLCGLVIALICVLKIALFDISGSTLAHAVALVVAGLVCFGISALYTYANKRLS